VACFYPVAPEIVLRLRNETAVQGENVNLTCKFYALPSARVTWLKGEVSFEQWASAHRGKWGQLTPVKKMDAKLKSESMQKRAVFYVCVIF